MFESEREGKKEAINNKFSGEKKLKGETQNDKGKQQIQFLKI